MKRAKKEVIEAQAPDQEENEKPRTKEELLDNLAESFKYAIAGRNLYTLEEVLDAISTKKEMLDDLAESYKEALAAARGEVMLTDAREFIKTLK